MWQEEHSFVAPIIETLELNKIFSSTLFFIVVTFFSAAILVSLWRMFISLKRNIGKKHFRISHNKNSHSFSFLSDTADVIETAVVSGKEYGYKIFVQNSSSVHIQKNSVGKYGSHILHLGFLLIIIAGIGTYTMQKRGFAQLIEGDTFFGWESEFLSTENGVLADSFTPNVLLSLETFIPKYYPSGNLESLESKVIVAQKGGEPKSTTLSINNPIEIDGVKIYQATSFGYTIGLKLERSGISIPTYFSLDAADKHHTTFSGISDFPTTDYIVTMEYLLNNERSLKLSIQQNGKTISSGIIKLRESLEVNGDRITFFDSRQWTGIIFTENKFVSTAFVGFVFIILGLIFLYGFPFSEIVISVQNKEDGVQVSIIGNAQREKAMFAEEFYEYTKSLYLIKGNFNVRTDLVEV